MKKILLLLLVVFNFGCSTSIEKYKDENPKFVLDKFFNGKLIAHGYFKDRFDHVKKRFVVYMTASWKDKVGIIDESFEYSDGTKSKRVWKLKKIDETHFEGTAGDVVGIAKGEAIGNTLNWKYVMAIEVDGKKINFNLNDWMYLIDENNLINQTYMTKFGIDVGEIVLSIKKL